VPFLISLGITCLAHIGLFYYFELWNENIPKAITLEKEEAFKVQLKSSILPAGTEKRASHKLSKLSQLAIPKSALIPKKVIKTFEGTQSGSHGFNLHEQIKQGVSYPTEFADLSIEGHVFVKIYIDKEGKYQETKSKFKFSSPFLAIHVRRVLRQTLSKPLRNLAEGYYPARFIFELTTGLPNDDLRSLENGQLNFYRKRYGGTKGVDKVNIALTETIASISNVLSLLKHLPSVKKQRKRELQRFLTLLKSDPTWAKE
jgi:hypothetical protein